MQSNTILTLVFRTFIRIKRQLIITNSIVKFDLLRKNNEEIHKAKALI